MYVGGPSFSGSSHTANNWPLKGTKMMNHEGGIRVNAWVSGGLIAAKYDDAFTRMRALLLLLLLLLCTRPHTYILLCAR